uniref:Uncharacterized protein n=1 Tax=Nelumbo nucifera TaxID=4432 RepID=A0A822YUQ5_NELNU|nr:TPA_asm: hypothetical protein HUJ06_005941 [Nelumbo nucifera]
MSDRFDSECFNSATTSLENSLLGISNCRPDSHVAQQSRRDKLRVQQSSSQRPPPYTRFLPAPGASTQRYQRISSSEC